MSGVFVVDVGLALARPPRTDRTSRVRLVACCALHAELDAIAVASAVHGAVMPVSSVVVDWPEP